MLDFGILFFFFFFISQSGSGSTNLHSSTYLLNFIHVQITVTRFLKHFFIQTFFTWVLYPRSIFLDFRTLHFPSTIFIIFLLPRFLIHITLSLHIFIHSSFFFPWYSSFSPPSFSLYSRSYYQSHYFYFYFHLLSIFCTRSHYCPLFPPNLISHPRFLFLLYKF